MALPNVISMTALRQLANWIARPYDFLDECAEKYGDTFTIKLVEFPPLVFLSNPQAIKEIFAVDARQFDAGRSNKILISLLGSNSVVLLDGDRHQRQRKLLMPPFHGEKVKSYGETICQITKKVGSQWQSDRPFLASKVMQDVTLEVILQAVFGLRAGERYQQLKPLLASLLDLTGSPLRSSFLFFPWLQQDWGSWSPWGKVVRQRRQVYELLQAEIDERRSQSSIAGNDVLSLLLSARDESGQLMSDIELKDELMTMLVAGHETTATVLAWALYWIHKIPAIKARLLKELNDLGDNAEPMAIASLPYLTAVANESLRIYPIVPIVFPRVTKQEITIDGHTFPSETTLVPCIYQLHHREDIYPQSKQFKPERFLERQFAAWEFIPFGGGNRRCLGYALAMLEIKLVLATILTNFPLKLADEQPVKYRRRGLTIATSNGVPLVLQS
jgi:cytochrome P450